VLDAISPLWQQDNTGRTFTLSNSPGCSERAPVSCRDPLSSNQSSVCSLGINPVAAGRNTGHIVRLAAVKGRGTTLSTMPSQLNSNAASWKQEVNRCVAAHKNRKGPVRVEPGPMLAKPASSRAAEVLARVNARYAKAPSYNVELADDARAVVRAAEAATRAAVEVQAAAESMLAGIEAAAIEEPEQIAPAQPAASAPVQQELAPAGQSPVAYEVRWSHELPEQRREPAAWAETAVEAPEIVPQDWQGVAAQERVLDIPAIEVVDGGYPIPGNLIEFPRELVATRKARRTYEPENQLSIFEVDPEIVAPLPDEPVPAILESVYEEQVVQEPSYPVYVEPRYAEPESAQPAYAETAWTEAAYRESVPVEPAYVEPQYDQQAYAEQPWPDVLVPRSIREEDEAAAQPAVRRKPAPVAARKPVRRPELDLAPTSARLLAGVVNLSLMMMGLAVAGLTAARSDVALPGMRNLELGAAGALVLIGLLYTSLFYLLSDSTPGMRYAHLRLVSFSGRRATRSERFVRLGGLVLSALPLGLGFLWMLVDSERLCWHDRLSRTYLRTY